MAKKKDLKSTINFVCDELMAECLAISLYKKEISDDDLESLLNCICQVRNDYVSRLSHEEPGMRPKAFYKDLTEGFNKQIGEILDHINSL